MIGDNIKERGAEGWLVVYEVSEEDTEQERLLYYYYESGDLFGSRKFSEIRIGGT